MLEFVNLSPMRMNYSAKVLMLLILAFLVFISLFGYYRNKSLQKNLTWTSAIVNHTRDISGDERVYRGGRFYRILAINYSYSIKGINYEGSAVVSQEDREYGLPQNLNPGSKIVIGYDAENPEESILRAKLKLQEDKIKVPENYTPIRP